MSGPASALIREGQAAPCHPSPRYVLTPPIWDAMRGALAEEPGLVFQGVWADTAQVHALFLAEDPPVGPLIASVPVEHGLYGALSPWRPGAALFERMVTDLWGHRAADAFDPRPWLDHGHWPLLRPMSTRPVPNAAQPEPWEPLPADGAGLNQIPVGPIHGIVTEPAQFRVTAEGEQVVRLEARLGYAHKGALLLMRGKSPRVAARVAARLSGDSTVAHSVAFARAVEAALGAEAPPRAASLRGVAAEMERIANHLGALGAIFGTAGSAAMAGSLSVLREGVLRACGIAFGHRLMMDLVVPGGVVGDFGAEGVVALLAAIGQTTVQMPGIARAYDRAGRLSGTGTVPPEAVARFAPGGVVGRAAGRPFDARRALPYPPYGDLAFDVPVRGGGDVDARVRVRLAEIGESLGLLRALLDALPHGPLLATLPSGSGEGVGWAEGCRGDVWHWVRLDGGTVAAVFARDPSWLHWPVLEAATAGAPLEDVPLIRESVGGSCSGVDL